MSLKQVLKNHVAIVLDCSSSMDTIIDDVRKVFNNQIEFLRKSSLLFEQETRVSVYTFSDADMIKCLIYDVDVARPMEIERLFANGMTALLDAGGLAITDLQLLPQKYGDHAFLVYLLTDGGENDSENYGAVSFKKLIKGLPENFTVAAFVPDNNGKRMMEGYGLSAGNVEKWDATKAGIEEVGRKFEKTMNNYYTARSTGTRSSGSLFADLNSVKVADVKGVLSEVTGYNLIINEDVGTIWIKELVENKLGVPYKKGSAYYELVKNETVQPSKSIAIQNKKNRKIYTGDNARNLLGLPSHENVKLCPTKNKDWNVYVQSLSVNRNIIPKQRVLVVSQGTEKGTNGAYLSQF